MQQGGHKIAGIASKKPVWVGGLPYALGKDGFVYDMAGRPHLADKKGKMVIEFVPAIPWDKGSCLLALCADLEQKNDDKQRFAIYIGDDVTDEDAFRVLGGDRGAGILVADEARDSAAEFRLRDPNAVIEFLALLSDD